MYHLVLAVLDHKSSRDQKALIHNLSTIIEVQNRVATSQDSRRNTRHYLVLVDINCIFNER